METSDPFDALVAAAQGLDLPLGGESHEFLEQPDITHQIHQAPPYLVLTHALRTSGRSLLAEARFPPSTCAGHYAGRPCLPLVDLGRAMDQAATLLAACRHDDERLPLTRRVVGLKGHAVERYEDGDSYWVWASEQQTNLSTKIFSRRTASLLASVRGYEHDLVDASAIGSRIAETDPGEWQARSIDEHPLDVARLTEQSPPFFIVREAFTRQVDGQREIRSLCGISEDIVDGHLLSSRVLGPIHYARCVAQTGMVLGRLLADGEDVVPEVVSTKAIWYDTQRYFRAPRDVVVTAKLLRMAQKSGRRLVIINATASQSPEIVFGIETFTYLLVPKNDHPIWAAA